MYVFDYHKLMIDGEEVALQDVLQSMIFKINETADEPITGILLWYDKYAVNMIEVRWWFMNMKPRFLFKGWHKEL